MESSSFLPTLNIVLEQSLLVMSPVRRRSKPYVVVRLQVSDSTLSRGILFGACQAGKQRRYSVHLMG